MKKRTFTYLIAVVSVISQLYVLSYPVGAEETTLIPEMDGGYVFESAEDYLTGSDDDSSSWALDQTVFEIEDSEASYSNEEFSVETDLMGVDEESESEIMSSSSDDGMNIDADLNNPGLVEDVSGLTGLIEDEEELSDGIMIAASDPVEIQADLLSHTIPKGSTSGTVRYSIAIRSSGIYHFVGTDISEFAFWEDFNQRIIPRSQVPIDGKLVTGLYLEAGKEYAIGAAYDDASDADTGSFYCYLSEYCVQIPNNSFTDEDSMNTLEKVFTYREASGSVRIYSSSVLNDVCHDGMYYFLTISDASENADGTYSVQLRDRFTGNDLGHCWGKGEVKTSASCAHPGIMEYTCLCGESSTQTIPKTAHTWGTYDSNGDRTCSVCKVKEHDASKVVPVYSISGKPAGVKAKAAGSRKLTVSWKKPAKSKMKKIKGFYIEVATDQYFTNIIKAKRVKKTKTSFTFKKLNKGTKYFVRVRFYNGSRISMWSAVKRRKVK